MIFFFYGPNTYAARQQMGKMAAGYIEKTGTNFGIERINGLKASFGQLQAALTAVPFLATSRLVLVEDLGKNKELSQKAESLLGQVPTSTIAVFYDPEVDQRTNYFKFLSINAKTVQFQPLSGSGLTAWVKKYVTQLGGEIEAPAITQLIDLAGEDQWRLSNEIAKLYSYDKSITPKSVKNLVEPSQNETVFVLIEAMTAGLAGKALATFGQLRSAQVSEMYILSMIIWQLRNLMLAKAAGKITPPGLAREGGMSPFVAGKMLSKRHLFSEKALKYAFVQAVETDYQIKTGVAPSEILVERLIYSVADGIKKQPA